MLCLLLSPLLGCQSQLKTLPEQPNSPLVEHPDASKPPIAFYPLAALAVPAPTKAVTVTFDTERSAIIGLHYFLQASSDLKHWTNVATFPASGAQAVYTEPGSAKARFYRAGWTF